MEIHWWELLAICHHPDMSYNHNHSDSGDIVFLIYHVTFAKPYLNGYMNLRVEASHNE